MLTIDADAHAIENAQTWTYVERSARALMPTLITELDGEGRLRRYWLIEGRRHRVPAASRETSEPSSELTDVGARLHHMDELEIDLQVLYPTVFLRPLTRRPDVELALCQSYNRWLSDIWSQGKDRLRWAAVLPLASRDAALDELRVARDHGACAVFLNGVEHDMTLDNPYFFPLYAAASDLDMPLGIHAGNNSFAWQDLFSRESGYSRAKLAVMSAFHSLLSARVPTRFPRLRIAFVEAAAQWIPATIHDLARRAERADGERFDRFAVLRGNRLFVTCQADDDLPYVLRYTGEDNMVIGTDYGHDHTATDLAALRNLRARRDVSRAVIRKILDDNARALYGLPPGEPPPVRDRGRKPKLDVLGNQPA